MSTMIKNALFGALAGALVIAGPGCRQKEDSKDEVVEKAVAPQSSTPSEMFAKHIAMLPPKPTLVGYFDIARVLSPRLEEVYAPTREPEQIDNLEKMRQEVSVIFLSNFGVDISEANAALVVANADGVALVLEGVTLPQENEAKALETEEIVGEAVFRFQDDNNARFPMLYMRELANESGVILYSSRELVELTMSSGEGQAAEMATFVQTWQGDARPRAFIAADLRAESFASMRQSIEKDVGKLPDRVVVSLEERTLVRMVGPRDEMKALADRIDAGYRVMTAALESQTSSRNGPLEEVAGTYASFLLLNYGMYLEKYDLGEEALTYSFPRLDDRYLPFWSGAIASIMIPNFLRAVKQSKTSEAEMVMTTLTSRVEARMKSQAMDGVPADGCKLPPGTQPSSAVPVGGSKVIPGFDDPAWAEYDTESLGLTDGAYFSYQVIALPEGHSGEYTYGNPQAAVVVEALADFVEGGPQHTIRQVITFDEQCNPITSPVVIMNEFE